MGDDARRRLKQGFGLASLVVLGLTIGGAAECRAAADDPRLNSQAWFFQLLPGSYLIDDCPPCGRPTIQEPLRGTFELRLVEENPLFSRYAMVNISWSAGSGAGHTYKVDGQGTYTIGGEVALRQDLALALRIDDGSGDRLCDFTNATPNVERLWPILEAILFQTNGTFTQVYELHVFAAPLREIWFSTAQGMTPGIWPPPTNHLSGGDLLSSAGRVVMSNRVLTKNLGLQPTPDIPDLGLDAVDVLPGGEVAFSMATDGLSETLGVLQHGDLLSSRGRILQQNHKLTAAFMEMSPPPDVGLDAVQILDNGEIYFSVRKDFFSDRLGRNVRRGDLLSDRGVVVKSNQQLLAPFQPVDGELDYGLDALHVWPSGEIWFSVENSFQSRGLGSYQHGDLLSDQGYVVARNLDLVGPFQPLEDLADFGLDALFVITDATPPAPAPRFKSIRRLPVTGSIALEWDGAGRVWEVQRAADLGGPWVPVSPIIPDLLFNDANAPADQSFYRLRQW